MQSCQLLLPGKSQICWEDYWRGARPSVRTERPARGDFFPKIPLDCRKWHFPCWPRYCMSRIPTFQLFHVPGNFLFTLQTGLRKIRNSEAYWCVLRYEWDFYTILRHCVKKWCFIVRGWEREIAPKCVTLTLIAWELTALSMSYPLLIDWKKEELRYDCT